MDELPTDVETLQRMSIEIREAETAILESRNERRKAETMRIEVETAIMREAENANLSRSLYL
jgi:hypothetical protein